MVNTLMWSLPVTIFMTSILDTGFTLLYMLRAHPWKDILIDEGAKKAKKQKKKEDKLKKKQEKP